MTALAESVGWLATAVVVSSFLFANPTMLRIAQIFGACLWLLYGAMIGSAPVIVANALVFATASLTTLLRRRQQGMLTGK